MPAREPYHTGACRYCGKCGDKKVRGFCAGDNCEELYNRYADIRKKKQTTSVGYVRQIRKRPSRTSGRPPV